MLRRLFAPRPSKAAGAALYAAAVAQARQPAFYRALGVEDRIDARFELYTLHVILLVQRLSGQGAEAAETSQVMFDTFVGALDHALRELGVGDVSVGKKMRRLGEAVYGRTRGLLDALKPDSPPAELSAMLARTIHGEDADPERAAPLADYVLRTQAALAAQPLSEILEGRPAWPSPQA